jgi:hypothetical protein
VLLSSSFSRIVLSVPVIWSMTSFWSANAFRLVAATPSIRSSVVPSRSASWLTVSCRRLTCSWIIRRSAFICRCSRF